ncbi:hypothetical protein IQ263_14860, partial [Tychonema sp. LEGE 06208]|nr:hypothetical protein [Tychonema sp. LEGE 06208]
GHWALGMGHWAWGGAKRRDWAERSGGIGRSEAEGLGIPHNAIEPLSVDPRCA